MFGWNQVDGLLLAPEGVLPGLLYQGFNGKMERLFRPRLFDDDFLDENGTGIGRSLGTQVTFDQLPGKEFSPAGNFDLLPFFEVRVQVGQSDGATPLFLSHAGGDSLPLKFPVGNHGPAGYIPNRAIPHKGLEPLANDPFGENGHRPDSSLNERRGGNQLAPAVFPGLDFLELFPKRFPPEVVSLEVRKTDGDLGRGESQDRNLLPVCVNPQFVPVKRQAAFQS